MRIVKILEEGLSPADGILCLTFTNSGVRAMRERLTDFQVHRLRAWLFPLFTVCEFAH